MNEDMEVEIRVLGRLLSARSKMDIMWKEYVEQVRSDYDFNIETSESGPTPINEWIKDFCETVLKHLE